MGRAMIVANLGNGRYTIEIDYGSLEKEANLEFAKEALVYVQNKIAEINQKLTEAEAKESAQRIKVEAEIAAYQGLLQSSPPGKPPPKPDSYVGALKELYKLQAQNSPLRTMKKSFEQSRANIYKTIAYWANFEPIERRNVWCVDYTTWAEPGSSVATIEIPGEPNVVLLAAGCRAWTENDGQLTARETQKPHQVFFNAAILPGWQKHYPTYRAAVIDVIYRTDSTLDGTCDVTLMSTLSSAQRLDVNQTERLFDVPIRYMAGDHETFIEGDEVVVQFLDQYWGAPVVIGFLNNPRPSFSWGTVTVYAAISQKNVVLAGEKSLQWWLGVDLNNILQTDFSTVPSSRVIEHSLAISAGSMDGAAVSVNVPNSVVIGKTTWVYEPVASWPSEFFNYGMPQDAAQYLSIEWINTGFSVSQDVMLRVRTENIAWGMQTHPTRGESIIVDGEFVGTNYFDYVTGGFFYQQTGSFRFGTANYGDAVSVSIEEKNISDWVSPFVSATYRGRTRLYVYLGSRVFPGSTQAEMYFIPQSYV